MDIQAEELNKIISQNHPVVLEMLSSKGKNIYFPKKGILAQTADAKSKSINATIGAAIEADGTPMRLNSLEELINIPPEDAFPYAPSFGRPDIRSKWKEMLYKKNPALTNIEISNPVVTNAITHGLSIVAYLFLDEGEDVLASNLYWENYNLIFLNGYNSSIETYRLFDGNALDVNSFREKMMNVSSKKKVVVLNFPNNPSGYTPTVGEMEQIIDVIKASAEAGNNIVAVMDDAYFGLFYEDDIEEQSAFAYLADLHENVLAVKLDGATKEDYVFGFRVGFITYGIKNGTPELYKALEAKTAGVVRGNISNACNLSQSLLLKSYMSNTYEKEKHAKYNILKSRYLEVKRILQTPKYEKYLKAYPFNSGYFMCVRLKKDIDGEKIRQVLLEQYDTGIINMDNMIRIAFSSVAEKDIPTLFENLYKACEGTVSSGC